MEKASLWQVKTFTAANHNYFADIQELKATKKWLMGKKIPVYKRNRKARDEATAKFLLTGLRCSKEQILSGTQALPPPHPQSLEYLQASPTITQLLFQFTLGDCLLSESTYTSRVCIRCAECSQLLQMLS